MSRNQTPQAEMRNLLAGTRTAVLILSLLALDAEPSSAERDLARGMTIGELELRYPAAAEEVMDAYDAAEDDGRPEQVDYVSVLVAAIPAADAI